jgi:hypothetical protein
MLDTGLLGHCERREAISYISAKICAEYRISKRMLLLNWERKILERIK